MLLIRKLLGGVFDSARGQAMVAIGALVGLFVWFVAEQRNVGAQNAVRKVNQQAQVKADQARAARAGVPQRGNVEWVLKHSCRDC